MIIIHAPTRYGDLDCSGHGSDLFDHLTHAPPAPLYCLLYPDSRLVVITIFLMGAREETSSTLVNLWTSSLL